MCCNVFVIRIWSSFLVWDVVPSLSKCFWTFFWFWTFLLISNDNINSKRNIFQSTPKKSRFCKHVLFIVFCECPQRHICCNCGSFDFRLISEWRKKKACECKNYLATMALNLTAWILNVSDDLQWKTSLVKKGPLLKFGRHGNESNKKTPIHSRVEWAKVISCFFEFPSKPCFLQCVRFVIRFAFHWRCGDRSSLTKNI